MFVVLLWIEKILWFENTVPTGEAVPWTNNGTCRFGAVKPTKKVIHHGSDWTFVLSIAPAQKPCGPYWLAVGVKRRLIEKMPIEIPKTSKKEKIRSVSMNLCLDLWY